MKKALITGDMGFVGSHMRAELEARGWLVSGVDTDTPGGLLQWVRSGAYPLRPYDLVVHCAYSVGGRAGIDGDNLNLATNLQLDASLFEWAAKTKQRRVLYFSSSAAYPVSLQTEGGPERVQALRARGYDASEDCLRLREDDINLDDIEHPDADYGFAKLAGERLARAARKLGLAVTVVRPFSGYGEDQSLDYPFPSIVARAQAGDLSVWGPPGQTRDWIHISDVCAGALAVCEADYDGPVNLCTGVGTEMGELMQMAFKQYADEYGGWPEPLPPVTYDESKPTGVFYRVGDPTLMQEFYTPKVSLEEGIQRALKPSSSRSSGSAR